MAREPLHKAAFVFVLPLTLLTPAAALGADGSDGNMTSVAVEEGDARIDGPLAAVTVTADSPAC